MKLKRKQIARSTAGFLLTASSIAFSQGMPTNSVKTGYAPVNGLRMYYEIHGSGEPLVLIHGGVIGITMFVGNIATLSKERQVIAVELQGHGHTADVERPLSSEAMANDVAALMEYLKIEKADVMGDSLGAGVALQLVFQHPELVRKLVVVSVPFKHDGWYPEVMAAFEHMNAATAAPMKQSPLAKLYPNVDWGVLFTKLGDLLRKDYDWTKEVEAIKSPTMLVFADADAIRPEHIIKFYELLGGGKRDAGLDGSGRPVAQLAILPGLTHYNIAASPALPAAVMPFLRAGLDK